MLTGAGQLFLQPVSALTRLMNKRIMMIRTLTLLLVSLAMTNVACRLQAQGVDTSVRSHLKGTVSVDAEIDSRGDYSGFEVIVGNDGIDGLDTLAFALTLSDGTFEMDVEAPVRGIYPLLIAREGAILRVGQLVVGEADSASFSIELPGNNQPWRIRSPENSAWLAFENTRALHNQQLIELIQDGGIADEVLGREIMQASMILWSLRDNFSGTVGADFASAESITMLETWNDSLLLERAEQIRSSNPAYIDVVRSARRAEARLRGQKSAINLLQRYQLRTDERDTHAAIQSEIVVAYIDSLDDRNAELAVRTMQQSYPGTAWAEWANRTLYEIENLLPGKPAPSFELSGRDGRTVSLDEFRGRFLLLEFYVPESVEFRRQIPLREAIIESGGDQIAAVAISLQSDPVILEALFEDRELTGRHVFLEDGAEAQIVRDYGVMSVPTRYVIDPEGRILGKYLGESLYALQQDLAELLGNTDDAEAALINP